MKFTLAAMALLASSALAAPAPEADPWCKRKGQSCWKRSAEASAEAVSNDKRWCERKGQSCWKAKRAAEAVLDVIGHENSARSAEAEPWCERKGQSCWKAKREAAPEADPWCNRPGNPCWAAKRDLANVQAVARSIVESYE